MHATSRHHIILVAGCQSVPQPNDSVHVIHLLSKTVVSVVICCHLRPLFPSVQIVRGRRDPSPRPWCSGVVRRYPIGRSIAADGIRPMHLTSKLNAPSPDRQQNIPPNRHLSPLPVLDWRPMIGCLSALGAKISNQIWLRNAGSSHLFPTSSRHLLRPAKWKCPPLVKLLP